MHQTALFWRLASLHDSQPFQGNRKQHAYGDDYSIQSFIFSFSMHTVTLYNSHNNNDRITESFRLENTLNIIEFSPKLHTAKSTTKPCPSVPRLRVFYTAAGYLADPFALSLERAEPRQHCLHPAPSTASRLSKRHLRTPTSKGKTSHSSAQALHYLESALLQSGFSFSGNEEQPLSPLHRANKDVTQK